MNWSIKNTKKIHMLTTKQLKKQLGYGKKLTFKLPGNKFGNYKTINGEDGLPIFKPFDITVTVFPRKRIRKSTGESYLDNHIVHVDGIEQFKLYRSTECKLKRLHDAWFKEKKNHTDTSREFQEDWRVLLGLNDSKYDTEGLDIVGKYLINKKSIPGKKSTSPSLVCIQDMVTKTVERIPKGVARYLVEEKEHYEYCSKREWRYYLHNQKPVKIKDHSDPYWKDETEVVKDEEGKEIITNYYLPRVPNKNQTDESRKQKREYKHQIKRDNEHKVFPPLIYVQFQTITTPPEYDHIIYKKRRWKHCKNKSKRIDPYLSKLKTEKYQIRQIAFDYEYVPRSEGSLEMKKIYKGKRDITVTIFQPSRTIYKTIVTRQYPNLIAKRRSIIKKNIEFLKKQQTEEKQKAEQKSE